MVDINLQVLAMKAGHAIKEYVDIFLLAGINQRLDVLGLVFFQNLCRKYIELHL